jgi:hypothetical protein
VSAFSNRIDQLSIKTIRTLSIDTAQQANADAR